MVDGSLIRHPHHHSDSATALEGRANCCGDARDADGGGEEHEGAVALSRSRCHSSSAELASTREVFTTGNTWRCWRRASISRSKAISSPPLKAVVRQGFAVTTFPGSMALVSPSPASSFTPIFPDFLRSLAIGDPLSMKRTGHCGIFAGNKVDANTIALQIPMIEWYQLIKTPPI